MLPATAPPSRRPHPRRAALPTRAQNERPRRRPPRPEASERGAAGARPFLLRSAPRAAPLRAPPSAASPRPAPPPGPARSPALLTPRPPGSLLCCCRSPAAAHGRNGSARAQFRPPPPAARLARTPGGAQRSAAIAAPPQCAGPPAAAGNGAAPGRAAPPGPGLSAERPPHCCGRGADRAEPRRTRGQVPGTAGRRPSGRPVGSFGARCAEGSSCAASGERRAPTPLNRARPAARSSEGLWSDGALQVAELRRAGLPTAGSGQPGLFMSRFYPPVALPQPRAAQPRGTFPLRAVGRCRGGAAPGAGGRTERRSTAGGLGGSARR